ncbi:zinc ribbon domain-containing protein [Pseudenhygromyxa sp. WMMC2535]|uniref:zinc ribbon domain-containing protein n=1 Tax=Pseudenhygromyxa sp. WMMC2535 TaxID=2712867 RepID=UPI0015553F8D|nr:zinc ribbon domain-containing protein [Pseudenhygromyxa sp. WMMC2535]NVB43100.1 zinc ribbon domain-containing protein [Pseudenhygromyxa sp. WMMC2535]
MPNLEFSDPLAAGGLVGPRPKPRVHHVEPAAPELDALDFDELLERVGALSERFGAGRCATAYQLHRPEDFPEDYEQGLVDVRALLRRLARHAGESDESLSIAVEDGRELEEEGFASHLSAGVSFEGFEDGALTRARFVVHELGDMRAMIGPCCVELARALVHRAQQGAPGRAEPALPSAVEGVLACYALGWGVLVTNACFDPRSVGEDEGSSTFSAWRRASLSFPPQLAARLLAAIHRAGRRDASEARRALNPAVRELFDVARATLEGEGIEGEARLRRQLRWGDPDSWPAAGKPVLDELVFDEEDEALLAAEEEREEQLRQPNVGRPVFRARPTRGRYGGLIGGLVAEVFGWGLVDALGLGTVGGLIGWAIGSQIRGSLCSDPSCGKPLPLDAKTCPSCGGIVVGEIDSAKQHLEALEEYEDRGEQGSL